VGSVANLGTSLLQLPLTEAVVLGSQAESQFKSSTYCNPSSTKGKGKGVGLGLAVAYGIIQRHQGKIEVQSREG